MLREGDGLSAVRRAVLMAIVFKLDPQCLQPVVVFFAAGVSHVAR